MLAGRVIGGVPLLLLLAALFLSFSRGAWAQFAFAAALLMILSQPLRYGAHSHSDYRGLRRSGCGRPCHGLLSERASLELSYDVGRYGRFGRYGLGADLALERPFGIGPLQFSDRFTEDPHNTFLNEFMSGGWLAGLAYFALCAVTLVMSTRLVFLRTPWQPLCHVLYAAYVAVSAESIFIDIEHWRHYFLILGALWGLMAASCAYALERASLRVTRAGSFNRRQ